MSRSSALTLRFIRQRQSQTDAIREAPEPVGARVAVWIVAILLAGGLAAAPVARIEALDFTGVPSSFKRIPGLTLDADVKVRHRSVSSSTMGGLLAGMGQSMLDL